MTMYEIEYLKLSNGKAPITEWLNTLDGSLRKRINQTNLITLSYFNNMLKICMESTVVST